jgi:hypothetical protein
MAVKKKMVPDYPEYLSAEFARETKGFHLEILKDDGLYRHLSYCRPETVLGRFEIVTWPGYLHIDGDWDGFTFARIRDMFEFFRTQSRRINPDYWSEKVTDGRERTKEYCRELCERRIWEDVRHAYHCRVAPHGLAKAVQENLIEGCDESLDAQDTAHQAVANFFHDGFEFHSSWEWSWNAYSHHFLMSCHAIAAIIAAYDAAKAVGSNG